MAVLYVYRIIKEIVRLILINHKNKDQIVIIVLVVLVKAGINERNEKAPLVFLEQVDYFVVKREKSS